MQVAYIKKLHLLFVPSPCYFYDPLRPTGRWKMESGPDQADVIYVEHKGPLFNRWVHEDLIVFGPQKKEEKFICKDRKEKRVSVWKCLASLATCGAAVYFAYLGGERFAFAGIAVFTLLLIWNKEG